MATWVVGDVHGCYDDFMELISQPDMKEDDRLIMVGDIIDRGPDSKKMLDWAMKYANKEDGKIILLCGNHEDNVITEYNQSKIEYEKYHDKSSKFKDAPISKLECHYNFESYMAKEGFTTIGDITPYIEWFRKLPLVVRLTVDTTRGGKQEYVIAHAWDYPGSPETRDLTQSVVQGDMYIFSEYPSGSDAIMDRQLILWYRDIEEDFFGNHKFLKDYEPKDNEILIHGHTPVFREHGYPEDGEVHFREHSINIDCGCVFREYGGKLAAIRLEDKHIIYV